MNKQIKRTERGWPGHFICSDSCIFRRNTLLEYFRFKIVISTVGNMIRNSERHEVGCNRNYETMCFHAKKEGIYWDADVERRVDFDSEWMIEKLSTTSDQKANEMHDNVVSEIEKKLLSGDFKEGDTD